jgi:ABC-2 type transport system ATP-binding protein
MIEVENLTKRYGSVEAIKNVSFNVGKGEVLGFLGPNGAGKTTTMRVLTCFHPATMGKATVAGYDVFHQPMEVKSRIGYLPETVPLYGDMRVKDYLNFVADVKSVEKKGRDRLLSRIMGECGIEERAGWIIRNLSKGLRQRVGLAQAVINDPPVLILDEPTIGLDPRQIIDIRQRIKEMAGRRTVILSSHVLPEVSMVCQRVLIINKGQVIAEDTPSNLTKRLQKNVTVRIQIRGPEDEVKSALSRVDGVTGVDMNRKLASDVREYFVTTRKNADLRSKLAGEVVKNNWELLELTWNTMTLEDIFVQLVTEEKEVEL